VIGKINYLPDFTDKYDFVGRHLSTLLQFSKTKIIMEFMHEISELSVECRHYVILSILYINEKMATLSAEFMLWRKTGAQAMVIISVFTHGNGN
jgi:hypothetical protein